ncbi:MAG TPA: fumarate reductase subunit FrdD [bacterium]|nr:fumarate reductase subunit FrdD [bacterium]
MKRSTEPLWWLLFAAGGTVAAFVLPVHVLLTGLAAPLGWAPDAFQYEHVATLVRHPLSRLYLFVVISLPLFHWAHRFRYGVIEVLQLHHAGRLLAFACYGTALVLTVIAAIVLIRL